ncbi:NAD(P)/FAD-dependent oxidoreductase [Nocardia sp. NPDC049220]|uniref:flavin-containing monooxygenase n=1 Tax=Nocardia sp. NPDC049220 TaxID=3155273 RepID=UPI003411BA22
MINLSTHRLAIAIVGTGFAGLAAAIELKKHGHDDIVLFERGSEVGGVWRENTYPGASCDVPSSLYSFSFEPNPVWLRRSSRQPDILAYLRRTAEKHDVLRHIRFDTEVTTAEFDEDSNRWTIGTGDIVQVDVLVSAVGQLSRPALPDVEGRKSFERDAFHSAEWDHSVELTGKRVAVIGTGASAIQFVPEIQPQVKQLILFQRTAPYLLPRFDTAFSDAHRRLFQRLPIIQKAQRAVWWMAAETLSIAFLYSKSLSRAVAALSRWHMKRQLKSSELLAKIWPDHPVGCKRILFSDSYLTALRQPNVDVESDRIEEIANVGVCTVVGVVHEVDVIIYATGFAASDFLAPMKILGQGRRDLRAQWSNGARAYLGVSVPYFPNLFLMYGPNTNLGAGSMVYMLESQAKYIRQAVAGLRGGDALVVRTDVADRYDVETQARLVGGVWSKCTSWYRAADGSVSNNWPGTSAEYRRRTKEFDASEFMRLSSGAGIS